MMEFDDRCSIPTPAAEAVMPLVGMYIVVASLICTIAMAADIVQALWQGKLWFPNRFFSLNAMTITLIAIAMKLPVDLSTDLLLPKYMSIFFLVIMLANFLPSLGLRDDRELLMNIVALAILVITIFVNMVIQIDMPPFVAPYMVFLQIFFLFSLVLPFSVALTVSATKRKLEHRYKESQRLVSSHQEKMFCSNELKLYVKKHWMMAETRNPQFVIACSPGSSALGVVCLLLTVIACNIIHGFMACFSGNNWYSCVLNLDSDYTWSVKVIFIVQSIGVFVGSIAPTIRCFTSISHYSLSKELSKNHLNVFRVEKHWIERFQQWKDYHVHSHIPGRHLKIIFHYVKNTFLNFCITLHIAVLVISKTICLLPRAFMILLACVWYFFKSFLEWLKKVSIKSNDNVKFLEWLKKVAIKSNDNVNSEIEGIEGYTEYVVQIEKEEKLSPRLLTNTLWSITKLLDGEKEPRNLMMLLKKSKSFYGVVKFNDDNVETLYPEETHNCWSLVVVTLAVTAIALPNIADINFKNLLAGVTEGLQIVRHIEEYLDVDGELADARISATQAWKEVSVHRTWLKIDLQKEARKRKSSADMLQWLGDKAVQIMKEFKESKESSIDHSPYKFILASYMYKISKTILIPFDKEETRLNDRELFEWISTVVADVLLACFTNLPRVIKAKCHHNVIEKRGDNIRIAAQLLGKTINILKILEAQDLSYIDQDSMAFIDRWRAILKIQHDGGEVPNGAASPVIQPSSSSNNGSIIVPIL